MGPAAMNGMATDGQCFDKRALLEGELIGGMKLACRQEHTFPHSAIHHHAEDLQVLAAVSISLPTGKASFAVYVWLDGTAIAGLHVALRLRPPQRLRPPIRGRGCADN
jgi:hypothetical protein